MKYHEIKQLNQAEIAAVPMFFAFNQQQFAEGLTKLNALESDLIKIPGGGFMRRVDKHLLIEAMERCEKRMAEFMATDEGMVSAIRYELANYEYGVSDDDPTEALDALDLDIEDPRVIKCLAEAIKGLEMAW